MRRFYLALLSTLMCVGCRGQAASPDAAPDARPTAVSEIRDPEMIVTADNSRKATEEIVAKPLSTEQTDFSDQWKSASEGERRTMADLRKVYPVFLGAEKGQIEKAFGQPTNAGVDNFGADVMRYELGDAPEVDGGGKYHLTFVFEDELVVSVMGSFATSAP
jgi:hypothetical protein